ncbi:LURP-one-related family protein [Clostridium baratii]|uniref:Protein of uncharacterized function (DUF567) n=1 Tax=Clostridium baratii TaxID=1561 RepID=A0A174VQ66_9CLOT|nr:LURP-one-related family protein [Clostridium baratii]CUQ34228.1 Protein of uncharacterised function (DUF567) [Clostridium baratii]
MRYILNPRLNSTEPFLLIKDEMGDICYQIAIPKVSIGEKLYFEDANGNKLFKLKRKLLHLNNTFIIERANEYYGRVKKHVCDSLTEHFDIDTPYGELVAKGDFDDYDFAFYYEDNNIAAKVSKGNCGPEENYIVDVIDFNDDGFILACAVIIDIIVHLEENL